MEVDDTFPHLLSPVVNCSSHSLLGMGNDTQWLRAGTTVREERNALGWTLERLARENATAQVIGELAAKLPDYQQRFLEEHVRYLTELNRRLSTPAK